MNSMRQLHEEVGMNLQHLETFLAAAREGSFTAAGEIVHLSQSAVSRQIQDLERELGVRLFERLGRRIALTAAGSELARRAPRLLQEAQNLGERLRDFSDDTAGELRVGGTITAMNSFLPTLVARLQQQEPTMALGLEPGYSAGLVSKLRANELDVAVLGGEVDGPDLVVECRVADEVVLVAAPAHSLVTGGPVPVTSLDGEDLVARPANADTQRLADAWFGAHDVRPSKILDLH
jgi:DNA-binding transcriptional LysR family regulator